MVWRRLMIELLQTTKNVILTETTDFLRTMFGKVRPLLQKFHPEMESDENTLLQLQSGKNPELENLIFRILQEIQTDDFLKRLDPIFETACMSRNIDLRKCVIHILNAGSFFSPEYLLQS